MSKNQKKNDKAEKVVPVRFRYPQANRYYLLTDKSGYPSAEFRFPNQELDRALVVREVDR
ncbi:MAG: hypothetical protein C4570_04425 [Ammonifex sp.]|nr:MAG: hypothetical protein C4570_04425 [Ammonifex sp.]